MRLRLTIGIVLLVFGVGFALVPFSATISEKGPVLRSGRAAAAPSIACAAPIRSGWTTASATESSHGAVTYDSSKQCGENGRDRLIVSGLAILIGLVLLGLTLVDPRRRRPGATVAARTSVEV